MMGDSWGRCAFAWVWALGFAGMTKTQHRIGRWKSDTDPTPPRRDFTSCGRDLVPDYGRMRSGRSQTVSSVGIRVGRFGWTHPGSRRDPGDWPGCSPRSTPGYLPATLRVAVTARWDTNIQPLPAGPDTWIRLPHPSRRTMVATETARASTRRRQSAHYESSGRALPPVSRIFASNASRWALSPLPQPPPAPGIAGSVAA